MGHLGAAAQAAAFLPVIDTDLVPAHGAGGDPAGAGLVRFQQPLGQVHQPRQIGHRSDRRQRVDAGQETQFAAVHVAQSGHDPLVQQGQADGPVRVGTEPPQCFFRIPVRTQQIGPQVAHGVVLVLAWQHAQEAKIKTHHLMRGRLQHGPRLERRTPPLLAAGVDVPEPLHLQMRMQDPALCRIPAADQQVLAAGHHILHRVTGVVGSGEPGHAQVAPGEHLPGQDGIEVPCRPPDGIALRHVPSVPRARRRCFHTR